MHIVAYSPLADCDNSRMAGAARFIHNEAMELRDELAVAMLHPGTDVAAWFLAHPRALLPEIGRAMGQFVEATAGAHDLDDLTDPVTIRIWCAQFVLRVQREVRRNGGPATFARLRSAPSGVRGLIDRARELDSLIMADDVFTAGKPLVVMQKIRDLIDDPGLLVAGEPLHVSLLLDSARMLRVLYRHTLVAEMLDLRTEITRTGLDPAPAIPAAHAAMLDELAFALADRYELSGGLQHMRKAARLHEQALSMTAGDDPDRADRLNSLGACHRDLYHGSGEQASLDKAIGYFEESVRHRPVTTNRNNLAVSLLDRSRLSGGTAAELDRAVAMFAAIAAEAADDDPELPRSLSDHADALLSRSGKAPGDAEVRADLDRAIELTERALALGPAGIVLARCQTVHADALARRARLTRDRIAHDRALGLLEKVRSRLPASTAMADQAAGMKVMAVLGRWAGDRSDDNLREVVATARAALDVIRHDRVTRARVTAILIGTVPAYAVGTGDVAELDRAIAELEAAGDYRTAGRVDGLPEQSGVTAGLALLHIERGRRARDLQEVQRGLDLAAGVADATYRAELTARGWTERFMLTLDPGELARALTAAEPLADRDEESFSMFTLWDRLDDAACAGPPLADGSDLAGALAALCRARAPRAHPAVAASSAYLTSQAYARRFERTGRQDDLRLGAEMLEQELSATTADSPRYGNIQMWAGSRWRELYTATGDPGHLARAIGMLEAAKQAAAVDSRLFRQACGNLGTAYRAQFNYTGELAALDRAITAYELGIDAGREDPNWVTASMNLANALRASFDFTSDRARLDRAIELHERVVAARPPGNPDRSQALHNLATSCLTRFTASEEPADLDRAIAVSTEAAGLAPPGTPMWQDVLSTLAILHETRFGAAGDHADLDVAVRLGREAAGSAEGSTSSRASSAVRLAQILQTRFEHGRAAADQAEAAGLYRELCAADRPSSGETTLGAAWEWLSWAERRQAWPEVIEACRAGMRVFGDLLRLQVSRGLRTEFTRRYREFTADAAFALALAGAPREAVMALEATRAFSLSDALQLHTADLARLREDGHAGLAGQFESAVRAWAAASGPGLDRSLTADDEPRPAGDLADPDAAIRAARAEVDRVTQRIRELPGQADFLRPPEFGDVVAAAAMEPLVYLVAAGRGGAALIVRGEQVQVVPLPALTQAATRRWLTGWYTDYARGEATLNWWTRLETLGRELWTAAIGPLTAELDGGPVTFVRTGYLELLPLTAAWTPDPSRASGRRYLLDEHNVRTVPNATVLTVARAQAARVGPGSRLLAVADPRPVTAPPLACAVAEVAGIQCRYPAATVLAGAAARPNAVFDALGSHEVVHLACHGHADVLSPLDSSLLLADDQRLTLRDIIRALPLRAGPVRLAVLSACETSIAGLSVPDEIISLPSGLLEAGVAGVVASQWRVPDLSAALTMIKFHAGWIAGSDPSAALRAAQLWLRDSTAAAVSAYLASADLPPEAARPLCRRLARMDPQRQAFAHPVHWAGFLFSGA